MNGKIEILNWHTETMKKNQIEILDLKNTISEINNLLDILIIRMEKTEKKSKWTWRKINKNCPP